MLCILCCVKARGVRHTRPEPTITPMTFRNAAPCCSHCHILANAPEYHSRDTTTDTMLTHAHTAYPTTSFTARRPALHSKPANQPTTNPLLRLNATAHPPRVTKRPRSLTISPTPLCLHPQELIKDGLLEGHEAPPRVPVANIDYPAVAAAKQPLLQKAAQRLMKVRAGSQGLGCGMVLLGSEERGRGAGTWAGEKV